MRRSKQIQNLHVVVLTLLALPGLGMGPYEPGKLRIGGALKVTLEPPEQPDSGETWLVEPEIELFHHAEGAGRDVLILHGGPGYPFRERIAALNGLTDRYRFHYYHQRGCGRSTRPIEKFDPSPAGYFNNLQKLEGALGLSAQIADIERIRRILGEDKLILLGHSFGGFLSAMYAAEFPDRVAALVLVAPADVLVFPTPGKGLYALVGERLPEESRPAYQAFLGEYFNYGAMFSKTEEDMRRLNAKFGAFYLAAVTGTSYRTPGAEVLAHSPGWMPQGIYMSMGMRHDYRAALKNVDCPVLVIHGEKDLTPVEASRRYVDALSDAKLVTIPGAAHMPFNDRPAEFAEAVSAFVAKLP